MRALQGAPIGIPMRLAFPHPQMDRRRAMALALVLLLHILLVGVLIMLAPPRAYGPAKEHEVTAFNVLPDKKPVPKPSLRPKRVAGAPPRPSPRPVVTMPQPVKPYSFQPFEMVDITELPNHKADAQAATGTADSGVGSDSTTADGTGPGGEPLYNAEWQREPTNAELAYYLPRGAPSGSWALIACRTVQRFKVEDCVELGDSPRGSGLARSIVNAAWQFRVKPPRVGGRALVGSWVKIRIDFSTKNES